MILKGCILLGGLRTGVITGSNAGGEDIFAMMVARLSLSNGELRAPKDTN